MKEKELIKMLIIDKLSKKEIAKKLNLSEVSIRKKIQKLRKDGILLGMKPIINYKNSNFYFSITGLDVEPEKLVEILDELKKIREIITIYLTSGDHTILLEIVCENIENLKELHKKISLINGVKRVCPSIVHEIIKY